MKFIHAGDIHLDSALSGLNAHDEAPVDLLRTATRSAFSALIDRAIAERVNFVLFPGDVFDTSWRDWNTGLFFVKEMARLNDASIPAYLLRGNHDAEQEMAKSLTMPPNVWIFGADKPDTFRLDVDGVKVAIHGQSYKKAATTENLAAKYPGPVEGCLNIGVLHTALQGYAAHAPYAPCTVEELQHKGMDYWALGHVHAWEILSETPWIAFSGNLQGRHVRECGPRGALLVTCEHGVIQRPERLFVDVLRWEMANVDLAETVTREDAVVRAGQVFRQIMDDADGRPVACRVTFTGKSAAHGELFGQERALRADVLAQALIVDRDRLWIEKVKVRTEPLLDPAVIAARADAMADLQALFGQATENATFMAQLGKEFAPLIGKTPLDVFKQDVPALLAAKNGDFAALLREVAPSVIARISREG